MLSSFPPGQFHPNKMFLRVLPLVATILALQGCNPIDQRTFDPNANRRPVLKDNRAKSPAHKPFIEIIEGTKPDVYQEPLRQSVQTALKHKRNILFTIDGLVPPEKTPEEQLNRQKKLLAELATPVAKQITDAGAMPIQLDIRVGTDPSIKQGVVRINVR